MLSATSEWQLTVHKKSSGIPICNKYYIKWFINRNQKSLLLIKSLWHCINSTCSRAAPRATKLQNKIRLIMSKFKAARKPVVDDNPDHFEINQYGECCYLV